MVDGDYWKLTSDLFSNLIEKPKMSEKNLKKPPPRYIFEIIVNTMKVTGFPKGLYTDQELDVKFFEEDKKNRLDFLQKAIDITKIVNGETMDVKSKNMRKLFIMIVTGDEPDKTNKFLQMFHKAATSGKDFPKYVKKYLDHLKKKEGEGGKEGNKDPPKEIKKEDKKIEDKKVEKIEERNEDKKLEKTNPINNPANNNKVDSKTDNKNDKNDKIEKKQRPESPKEKKNKAVEKKEDVDLGIDKGNKIIMSGTLGKKISTAKKDDNEPISKSNINLKDLESIKNYIHEISLNINPIGNIIDYLPEDIDAMNKELVYWVNEGNKYKENLEEEMKKSEEIILPLENEYVELEETIKDEIMRIKSIKSRILKNELIVQNLINGVISVKSDNYNS